MALLWFFRFQRTGTLCGYCEVDSVALAITLRSREKSSLCSVMTGSVCEICGMEAPWLPSGKVTKRGRFFAFFFFNEMSLSFNKCHIPELASLFLVIDKWLSDRATPVALTPSDVF